MHPVQLNYTRSASFPAVDDEHISETKNRNKINTSAKMINKCVNSTFTTHHSLF